MNSRNSLSKKLSNQPPENQSFGMKLHHLLAVLITCTVLGCRASPREQDIWAHLGERGAPQYQNFYVEFSKYPEYGIADYPIDEVYDPKNDLKHLREALRQCRA